MHTLSVTLLSAKQMQLEYTATLVRICKEVLIRFKKKNYHSDILMSMVVHSKKITFFLKALLIVAKATGKKRKKKNNNNE